MVVPVIALGVYELLAAGAAATGLGAVAVAKRREIAEGLSDAADATQQTFRETAIQSLPYIIGAATGTRLWRPNALPDVAAFGPLEALPLPGFADADAWGKIGVPHFPAVPVGATDATPPVIRELPRVGDSPMPPVGGPPEDPLGPLRRVADKAKEVAGHIRGLALRISQNRAVQIAYTLYKWQTYALAGIATAEISRRMIMGDKARGPILYDYVYEPLFDESVAARTLLGGYQLTAEETSAGTLAVMIAKVAAPKWLKGWLDMTKFLKQLPAFLSINAYAFIGNWSFIEHQIAANNIDAKNVDFDRATRTAALFGFTSIAYFPIKDWLINLPIFGRIGFAQWLMRWKMAETPSLVRALTSTEGLNWLGAQIYRVTEARLGHGVANWLAPHYVPKVQTVAIYALFASSYRYLAQWAASQPLFEDSDKDQSLAMTNTRSVISTLIFDPYFYLGAKSNSVRSILGNQLVFMGLVYYLDQFYSPFDGKDVAVNEARRAIQAAAMSGKSSTMIKVTHSKPLTHRNFMVPPSTDLSVGTWTELSVQLAKNPDLNTPTVTLLLESMRSQLKSTELGDRRVGRAIALLLSHVANVLPFGADIEQLVMRGKLAQDLQTEGVSLDDTYRHHALTAAQLRNAFETINNGTQDAPPVVHFKHRH